MPCSRIPDQFPVLERDGLVLRQIDMQDGDRWHQRLNDAEGLALSGDLPLESREAVDGLIADVRHAFVDKVRLRWAIVPPGETASVGSIGFEPMEEDTREMALGISIGRAWWNQGWGSRAVELVLDYAFGPLGLEKVTAEIWSENPRSRRVAERIGFRHVRRSLAHEEYRGEARDVDIFELTAAEWPGSSVAGGRL